MSAGDQNVEVFEVPEEFEVKECVGKGAYGTVCRARKGEEEYAIKKIPNYTKSPDTARRVLRELQLLLHFQQVDQVVAVSSFIAPRSKADDVYVVMEYMPTDLSNIIRKSTTQLTEPMIKWMMAQMLLAVRAMHAAQCIHRDLSSRNILVDRECNIRVADFGLARFFDPDEKMSMGVVTQWYRAPEVLMGGEYGSAVDVWSLGCIMGELFLREYMFTGKPNDVADQLSRIIHLMGTPNPQVFQAGKTLATCSANARAFMSRMAPKSSKMWERVYQVAPSDDAKELMLWMLEFDPDVRVTAAKALQHRWFTEDPDIGPYLAEQEYTPEIFNPKGLSDAGSDMDKLCAEIAQAVAESQQQQSAGDDMKEADRKPSDDKPSSVSSK